MLRRTKTHPALSSANFLSLNTLRYLVLSYVTNATTISAITVIPANIPNPIGSTGIVWPGKTKLFLADGDAAASLVPLAVADAVLLRDDDEAESVARALVLVLALMLDIDAL